MVALPKTRISRPSLRFRSATTSAASARLTDPVVSCQGAAASRVNVSDTGGQ